MNDTQSDWLQAYEVSGVLAPGLLEYVRAEQRASHIRHVSSLLIPGFFQTEQYAGSVLCLWPTGRAVSSDEPDQTLVQFRLDRQWHLFERESSPLVEVMIDEAALLKQVGDRQVMYDQIVHLRDLADRPRIALQIVPLSVTLSYVSAVGAISAALLSFAEPGTPELLSAEELLGSSYNTGNLHETRSFKMEFMALQRQAMSADQSRDYLDKLAERILTGEQRYV